jgi:hypothetical protein
MGAILRYVGMDVHAETIAVAVVESDGRERDVGDPEPARVDPQMPEEAGATPGAPLLLRGRADGIRTVLAAGGDGDRVHGGGPDADPDQGR